MKKTNYWIVALCILSTLTLFAAQDFDALLIELAPLVEANDTAAALKKGARFFSHILNEQAALKQRVASRAAKGLPVGKANIDREAELKKWLADTRALLETFRYAHQSGLTLAGSDFQPCENEQRVFKADVLTTEPEFALWTVGGSSRVDREFFQLPSKVWNNGKLRFVLQAETVVLNEAIESGTSGIALKQAANEYESFNLVVTPKTADLEISNVWISDLKNRAGAVVPASGAVIKYVGEVSGYLPDGSTELLGPYPDVRFPLSYDTVAEAGKNYAMYCTLFVPPGTAAGDYTGTVSLTVGAEPVSVPLTVSVYPVELPHDTTVNMMLMGMWLKDMDYHYGTAPWSDESQKIKKAWAEQMADLRFSLADLPLIPRIRWEEFPVQGEGSNGRGMMFGEERELVIAGPSFADLGAAFTVSFDLKTSASDLPEFMKQRWSTRPSGYDFRLQDGKMSALIGIAPRGLAPEEIQVSSVLLSADWPDDSQWHRVQLRIGGDFAELSIDGAAAEKKELPHPLSPAYGQVTLSGSGFAIDELRWAQAGEELCAYSFEEPEYDFASRVSPVDPENLDIQDTLAWAQWAKEHGLYSSITKFPSDWTHPQIDERVIEPLRKLGMVDQISVKMPCDEAVVGRTADINIAFAKAWRKSFPDVKIYHPIGAMGGVRNPWDKRLAQLERYAPYVDIWGMRPVIADTYWDSFFQKQVAEGDNLAPYIHFCDQVENPNVQVLSRNFFYRLYQLDTSAITYWAVNLWYQPIRAQGHGSRAERKIWEVPNGYRTIRRNWTGITAGMVFYPLPEGPEASLIAMTWRDGIEDYEYLNLLEDRLTDVQKRGLSGTAVQVASELIHEIKRMTFVENRWTEVPTADSGQLAWLRERTVTAIAALDQLLK